MSLKNFFKELSESENTNITMTDKQICIISAAIEIFSEKGYSATTTSEIAKKAGVGEGTIFRHYKTKLEMLLAIPNYLNKSPSSKSHMSDLTRIFESPYEKFEDFIKDVIQNRKEFILKNTPLIKVLVQEVPLHPELRDTMSESVLFPNMEKLIQAIDRFKEKGQIINIPSETIVHLLLTSMMGYFFTIFIASFHFNVDYDKEPDYLAQYILHGLSITDNKIELSREAAL
ncbi:MAG: TetR/AcrR family transcriptional regulator [Clostridiales bacterium]|nr:TetR/AcrR family transcriptional regulator [Clostridiales bacterium]